MQKFRGVDYYGVEALLSDEERMVRDAVRDWVEAEFLPLVTEHHRAGTFPREIIPPLGELGIRRLGLAVRDKVKPQQQAAAADVADTVVALLQSQQAGLQPFAEPGRTLGEAVTQDDFDHLQPDRGRKRIRSVGRVEEKTTFRCSILDLRRGQHGGQRQSGAQRLGQREVLRHDAVAFAGE